PGYELGFSATPAGGELEAEVRVTELATGALSAVRDVAVRAEDGTPTCQVGDARFTLATLFGVQREHLAEAVGWDGASAARGARPARPGRGGRRRPRPRPRPGAGPRLVARGAARTPNRAARHPALRAPPDRPRGTRSDQMRH